MKKFILIFVAQIFCHEFALSCEKLTSSQIKDYYFSAVTNDVAKAGILCMPQNSHPNSCTQQDKNRILEHWNAFVTYSNLRLAGPPLIKKNDVMIGEKYGTLQTCSFYVRIP